MNVIVGLCHTELKHGGENVNRMGRQRVVLIG